MGNMRIIAGEFGGRALKAPKGSTTRPTTDRVRESLMSTLASARGGFDGAVVLDAFAGSGALSLEALSRGALCAHLYERDRSALQALSANIQALRLPATRARLHRADVLKGVTHPGAKAFDLVFLDPPYAFDSCVVFGMVARLCDRDALADGALIAYEHAASDSAAVEQASEGPFPKVSFTLETRKKYGDTVVDVFRAVVS